MNQNLTTILQNPHLRWAAIGIVALELAEIFVSPDLAVKLEKATKIITFYAILAAANSTPPPPKPA